MARGEWIPSGVDIPVPSVARTYGYVLGGAHDSAVDRALGERIETMMWLRTAARVNRAFLGRVVRFMVDRGVRQFLDIGSGIPPWATCTRSPRRRCRAAAGCTSTATRWPSRTAS